MTTCFPAAFALAFAVFAVAPASAQDAKAHWPAGAKVYFIEPKDGAEISGPVKVVMGLSGLGVAPAGVAKEKTGHHHVLIDTDVPSGEAAEKPMPMTDQIKHFGGGQTETSLTLPPGKHTLQLVVGDQNHIPHDPPLASEKISVTVK